MFDVNVSKFIEMCEWDTARFLIFSDNVFGSLIYYSHLLPLIASLILAIFVFYKNSKTSATRWLLIVSLLISIWLFSDLVLWATEKPSYVMFFWTITIVTEPMIYVVVISFLYTFLKDKDISFLQRLVAYALLLPIVILLPTEFAIQSFNLSNCEREVIEGPLVFYGYIIETLFILWIIIFAVRQFQKGINKDEKRKIALSLVGVFLFLASFTLGNLIGSFTGNWEIGQYGLFGIPIFLGFLGYLIIRYRAFNIKVVGTQMLVAAMWIALLSLLFIRTIENVRIIIFPTLILLLITGVFLVRGVKKEVKQKEDLQNSAEELYGKNFEIVVKNKTLSLLERLYETSIQKLEPEQMAKSINDIILEDLKLEFTGIYIFKKESDTLIPLAFSKSEKLMKTLYKLGFLLSSIKITDVSRRDFFRQTIYNQTYNTTNNLKEVWNGLITFEHLEEMEKESHIKTVLVNPLIISGEVFGALLLGFNRDYETLNTFEKASIRSFINVIALSLDKAYLYKNLQESYEITKRAYAVEKKAKEELANLDKTKNQFLLTVQHHLRTPLTSMMGYSDLLLKGNFGKQNKKTTEVIQRFKISTQGLIKMVNDFLDITQFQLGKSVIITKPGVELLPILDEIVNELTFKAGSKGIYLKFEKPTENFKIKADREKLKAAIYNVFDNAVKYTEKGGVTIKIKNQISNVKNGENDKVIIGVKDTGIGIPKEKINNIFNQIFERTEEAKRVSSVGSGVGLYLSGQIIKSHNGKVWVESEGEGKGSTFYIELLISNV